MTDLNSFNQFFIDYQQRFVHFAYTYVHDKAIAEDLVIEAMMYYWENRKRLSADVNVPAYVLVALKHKCIDYLRHRHVRETMSDELSIIYAWDLSERLISLRELEPDEIFTEEIKEIVSKTLASLPQRTRQIFTMSRYESKSHKEIANIMDMTTKGVEFHISQAIKALRIALKDYLPASLIFFYIN